MTTEVTLDGLSAVVDSIIQGGVSGRTLVKLED
jgi:hypothetical protein